MGWRRRLRMCLTSIVPGYSGPLREELAYDAWRELAHASAARR